MSLLQLRELLQFPAGDNATDTVVNGIHFNKTALEYFNYTIYSNNTISNHSKCYLIFDNFQPHILSNGSWINATTCYVPYYAIRQRGIASIVFGALFGLSIVFTLINLRKHGQLHLREDKRFRVVGRRWQWYWMLFVAACGMLSTFTGIDVDRYYLQQIPIILQSFFFMLMVPGALAMVWECTRHWASWQERQIVDGEPFSLRQDDRRSTVEFYLPLIFYLFAWLNFFMTIPRSWTPIQKQNTPEDIHNIARPAATGAREKAGAILAAIAWLTILASLHHSLKAYKSRPLGLFSPPTTLLRAIPPKISLTILLLALRIAYGIASAWLWDLSIFQAGVAIGWPFGLGYAPILLILLVFEIAGFRDQNEDKAIQAQRRARGQMHDRELGLTHKPHWWNRTFANRYRTDEQRLKAMTREVGAGRPTGRSLEQGIEMGDMNVRNRSTSRSAEAAMRVEAEDPFRDQSAQSSRGSSVAPPLLGARLTVERTESDGASVRTGKSDMTGRTLTGENAGAVPPQRIRSMLDV